MISSPNRKAALRKVLNSRGSSSGLHYADHVSGSGVALFDQVCKMDLEGIVAKHATAPYLSYHAISTWYKIKNPHYSQMAGRQELFEQERHNEPVPGWHSCDLALRGSSGSATPHEGAIARLMDWEHTPSPSVGRTFSKEFQRRHLTSFSFPRETVGTK